MAFSSDKCSMSLNIEGYIDSFDKFEDFFTSHICDAF